ncbi:MAG: thioredoxin family protein [Pirellulales bacterium]|nr:thioredoxin family protein [Pirellulales bacterium]
MMGNLSLFGGQNHCPGFGGRLLAILVGGLACFLPLVARAVEPQAVAFNEVLKIGDAAPDWSKLTGIDGHEHALAEYAASEVVVLVFTCVTCPTAADYEARIQALIQTHGQIPAGQDHPRVRVIAINSNQGEADSLAAMTAHAQARKFAYPFLADPSQSVARAYGALTTPQFFVLDKERRVAYQGAMDDNSEPAQAKENYVTAAVESLLGGKEVIKTSEPPRGCRIKFARVKR